MSDPFATPDDIGRSRDDEEGICPTCTLPTLILGETPEGLLIGDCGCLIEPGQWEELRYDVRATCFELDGQGADGAYSLIGDGLTPTEIADRLADVLQQGFGLTNAGPCRLVIQIAPAGRGDDLPL